jgi:hypothetical protein
VNRGGSAARAARIGDRVWPHLPAGGVRAAAGAVGDDAAAGAERAVAEDRDGADVAT